MSTWATTDVAATPFELIFYYEITTVLVQGFGLNLKLTETDGIPLVMTFTISPGIYTQAQFATELQTKLTTVSLILGYVWTYTVTAVTNPKLKAMPGTTTAAIGTSYTVTNNGGCGTSFSITTV